MWLLSGIGAVILFLTIRSAYKVIWKFNTTNRWFAFKHVALFMLYGMITFSLLMVVALGSMGHGTTEYHEIYEENILFAICGASLFVTFFGSLTALVKGFRTMIGKK